MTAPTRPTTGVPKAKRAHDTSASTRGSGWSRLSPNLFGFTNPMRRSKSEPEIASTAGDQPLAAARGRPAKRGFSEAPRRSKSCSDISVFLRDEEKQARKGRGWADRLVATAPEMERAYESLLDLGATNRPEPTKPRKRVGWADLAAEPDCDDHARHECGDRSATRHSRWTCPGTTDDFDDECSAYGEGSTAASVCDLGDLELHLLELELEAEEVEEHVSPTDEPLHSKKGPLCDNIAVPCKDVEENKRHEKCSSPRSPGLVAVRPALFATAVKGLGSAAASLVQRRLVTAVTKYAPTGTEETLGGQLLLQARLCNVIEVANSLSLNHELSVWVGALSACSMGLTCLNLATYAARVPGAADDEEMARAAGKAGADLWEVGVDIAGDVMDDSLPGMAQSCALELMGGVVKNVVTHRARAMVG